MINIAVIGAGYWGTKVITEYAALAKKRTDVRLVGIADVSTERLSFLKNQLSPLNLTLETDYSRILEDPEITGVHIATSNETHYEIASKAIAAGKHVLLEKPMSLNYGEAFRLARTAEKQASVLLIGHIFRFNNAVNKIKELYEKGNISKPLYVQMTWSALLPPPSGREIIFDLAPHPIDILNHIFEEWPIQVYVKAVSCCRKKVGLEEVAFATFVYPDNMPVTVSLTWLHHAPRIRELTFTNKNSTTIVDVAEQKIAMYEEGHAQLIPVSPNNTIEAEINHFIDAIKNSDPPINSALTGAMNVTVLQAMRHF
jgi:predicted dehydrogenase